TDPPTRSGARRRWRLWAAMKGPRTSSCTATHHFTNCPSPYATGAWKKWLAGPRNEAKRRSMRSLKSTSCWKESKMHKTRPTQHAVQRLAQRGFHASDVDLIMAIGSEVRDGFLV